MDTKKKRQSKGHGFSVEQIINKGVTHSVCTRSPFFFDIMSTMAIIVLYMAEYTPGAVRK